MDTNGRTDAARWSGSTFPAQVATLTMRSVRAMVADPRALVLGAIGPVLMLAVLSNVFGSIADPGIFPAGARYVDYLVPTILITTGISAGQVCGQAFIRDLNNGVLARFRSLPVRPLAMLLARSLADLARYGIRVAALLVFAFTVAGFRPTAGAAGLIGGLLVALLLTWSIIWLYLLVAAWLRSAEVLSSAGMLMFPVMFASSAFAPVDRLPAWLRVVATGNPLTYGIDATRNLILGGAAGTSALLAVAASVLVGLGCALGAITVFDRSHRR